MKILKVFLSLLSIRIFFKKTFSSKLIKFFKFIKLINTISSNSQPKIENQTEIKEENNQNSNCINKNNDFLNVNYKLNFSNPKTQKKESFLNITKANTSNDEINLDKSCDYNDWFKIINPYIVNPEEKNDNTIQIKKTKGFFYDFISGKKMINLNGNSEKDNNINSNINNKKTVENIHSHTKYKIKNANYNLNFSSNTRIK